MTEQFLLPDVGEGLTEAEIVAWKVKVGDEVAVNQVLVEIETAKSLVELPSPFSGTVVDVLVDEGQTVDVGTAIITVQAGAGSIGSEVPAIPAHPAQLVNVIAPIMTEPGGAAWRQTTFFPFSTTAR
ncbi:hypothetical protein C5B92_16660, partial [Rathayibacter sp. AY1A4]|uniref:biotin/lipoyl-containing protein n=1 Tax=Rathayibacter sp. AY1A4 TaxID=2080522 RepID=UPI000D47F629